MSILLTICGRAGSKGCKNKNVRDFLGAPLVYYTLASAFDFKERCGEEVDVCLNTDSDTLRDIVLKGYPEVNYIQRSAALGEDHVPKAAVWHNCIDVMEERLGRHYEYMIDLDITSPLRQIDDVLGAYQALLARPDADMAESVCPSRRNPFFNMCKEDNGFISTVIPSAYTTRQEAPAIYDENASIYVLRTVFFHGNDRNMLEDAKTVPYLMKDTAVLDIDSEEDFDMMTLIGGYLFDNVDGYRHVRELIRKG